MAGYGPCTGPISDRHEIVRASQSATSRTDPRLILDLCRGHHELDLHKPTAIELGLRIDPNEWRRCAGDETLENALIDEAHRRRTAAIYHYRRTNP